MAIIAVSQIQFNPTQPIGTNNLNLGSGFNAVAFHFHTSIICSVSAWDSIDVFHLGKAQTRIAAFPQKRAPRSVGMTSSFAVVHGIRGESIGCPVVLKFSFESINLETQAIRAGIRKCTGVPSIVHVRVTGTKDCPCGIVERMVWNTPIDYVDRSTDGIGAIQKRGRPTQQLDTLDEYGVDRDCMILGRSGEIKSFDAVAQHPNTVSIQSPNDWTICDGPEEGLTDARLIFQGLGNRSRPGLLELFA